jgi:hypothetical protein
MAAPYFLSRVASGSGWGGPIRDQREKTLVFPHESHRMLPPGLYRQATSLLCHDGGFLTWAAKPSMRKSPDPAINVESILTGVTSAPAFPLCQITYSSLLKFLLVCDLIALSLTLRAAFR